MNKKIFGAGIIAIDCLTGRILLARRGLKGDSANTWATFGGTFDLKDVMPRNTAIREFKEETGCNTPYQLSLKPFYINDSNQLKFFSYIGLFDGQFDVKINAENLDFDWFNLDHLPENLHPGVTELMNDKKDDLLRFIEKIIKK